MSLTFLTPLFLIGALSAAIPLVIHLSRSRRTKKMRFSTTRFFTDQFLRSYRMSRLKELLLLACRMALFAFLAIALARPLVLPKGQIAFLGGSRNVVLVVDNSASMGQVEDGSPIFEKARAAAREVLDGLKPGDTATIVLAGRRDAGPEVLIPQPTENIEDVRQALADVNAMSLATDLSGALAKAESLAKGGNASSKEVYVFSDLQDSGWDESPDGPGGSDVSFTFVQIKPRKKDNLAITAVQYGAARPMVGVPFEIKPYVGFVGDRTEATVRLVIDGNEVALRRVEQPTRSMWATPRFHHTFAKGGWHSGFVEVLDEVLPLDNRRYFAFPIIDSVKVLAVNGAPASVPHLDELAYLRAALTATADEDGQSPIQIDAVSPAELTARSLADLKKYPLIILANVESLAASVVEKLEEYVDGGGRLFVTLGDKVRATSYNESLANAARPHGGLLPGKLVKVQGDPASGATSATVSDVDTDHPALSSFGDPRSGNLMLVRFKAFWEVERGDSAVLMGVRRDAGVGTGFPLLLEKEFGRGRVMLFTSTIDADWTNFPFRTSFLPWSYRLVGYLAQDAVRQSPAYTGNEIDSPLAVEGSLPVTITKPDGKPAYPTPARDDPTRLVLSDTTMAGVYSFTRSDRPDRPALVAVNLPSDESNLLTLDESLPMRFPAIEEEKDTNLRTLAGLRKLLPNHPEALVQFVDDPSKIGDVSAGVRRGVKFWDILLILVLLIALIEPWLANRITSRHYGDAKPLAADALAKTGQGAGRLVGRDAVEVSAT
jgi:uncharacterized membrane protein